MRRILVLSFIGITPVVAWIGLGVSASDSNAKPADSPIATAGPSDLRMFGGTIGRNMVNLKDSNTPVQMLPLRERDDDGKEKVIREADATILWKATLGSKSYSGPIVSNGKLFVGTNNDNPRNKRDFTVSPEGDKFPVDKGIVMCFAEKDGKFLWQAVHDKLPSGQVHDWPREGLCSTPTVEGDRLYYVSNRCTVVCADVEGFYNGNQGDQNEKYKDPTDVDIIWEYDMMRELNVFPHNMSCCCPLIVGDRIFIVTANGVDENHLNIPSPAAPSFISLTKGEGKLIWKSALPGKNIMHGQWSNPAYAEIGGVPQVIFPGGDGWLYSLKPENGEVIWKFDANPKDTFYKLGTEGTKNDFIGTPVVHEGRIYIGVGQDPEHFTSVAYFYCIDPAGKTGDISSELPDKSETTPDGKIKSSGKPNPNSGQAWRYGGNDLRKESDRLRDFVFGRTMSTACVVDGICYIAELQGQVHCLDAKTGKRFWIFDTQGAIWGSTYYVDNKIYIAVEGGDVFVLKHDKHPKTIDELAVTGAADDNDLREKTKEIRKQVTREYLLGKMEFDAPVRSTVVVINGVTYVLTENTLYAFKKK